jgi:23S rRNA (cytosine1962-C5)-methyltransferase
LAGHLWIFSNEIYGDLKAHVPGSVVEVYDRQEEFMGMGYINPNSLIAIRLLSRERTRIDREFIRKRLTDALDLRKRLFGPRDACRLVYSEGDYLPGLIVDKYRNCLALQFLTFGMEALKDTVTGLLDEMLNPDVIILRNESRSRALEGLPLHKDIVKGSLDVLPVISEEAIVFEIDPYEGQKTGFFLDQRENRTALRELIKGGRGLDLFCYSGAWALNAAFSGAQVTGVDESERAVGYARRNAELNNMQDRVSFVKENVFAFLRAELQAGEKRYDFIVLDPPAFVKSASKIKEAEKAYRELNDICMRLIKPGGILATSSCSYHMSREMFIETLNSAGRDAGRSLRLLALRSQGKDHPVLLAMPETEYLKCAFLVVD